MSIAPLTNKNEPLILKDNSCKLLQEDFQYTEQVTSKHTYRGLGLAICRCLANSIIEIKPLRDPSRISTYNNMSTDGGNVIALLKEKQIDKNQQHFWTELKFDLQKWLSILLAESPVDIEISDDSFWITINRSGRPFRCELPDLGAGVSEILMLLAYLRLHPKESFCVVIDEPESHLHPGAVVELINIITTHLSATSLMRDKTSTIRAKNHPVG